MSPARARVLPLAATHGLVMAALYVLKPVRNALVLDQLGVRQLPWVLLLVAILGGVAAVVFARLSQGMRLRRLVPTTFVAMMACLVAFRMVLPAGGTWLVYAFYVWVTLYGLLVTSLLWLLANDLFDAREARRQFGFIGSGGIVGAVLGGVFTGRATHVLGTENLLLVCVGLLGAGLAVLRLLPSAPEASPKRRGVAEQSVLEAFARSELLRLMAITAGLGSVVAVLADVQFNEVVSRSFATRDAKTAFFGEFFAWLSALAFGIQLLVTPRILTRWGVGVALLLLPAALGTASVAVLLVPALWTAVLIKGADGGLRHSVHKSASEIVLIPLPASVKQKTKLVLDATVDTIGQGLGALAVLLLIGPLGLAYSSLGLLSVALVVVWLIASVRMRRAYVNSFREALARRELDLTEVRTPVGEAAALESLRAALESTHERQVVYALDLLAGVHDEGIAAPTRALLSHPSHEVRRRAVRVLAAQEDPVLAAAIEPLVLDPDADVRLEAMSHLLRHTRAGGGASLRAYLEHEDARTRCAAIAFVAEHGSPKEKALIDDRLITSFLEAHGGEAEALRAQIALALGRLEGPGLYDRLESMMRDGSTAVARAAMEGAGRTGDVRFVPSLIDGLASPRLKRSARLALVAIGEGAVSPLDERLGDPRTPRPLALRMAGTLAEIPVQGCVDALLARISTADAALQIAIARALSKVRRRQPDLAFDASRVRRVVREALRTHCEMLQAAQALAPLPAAPTLALLERAVRERVHASLEQAFRALGLLHPAKDIHAAHESVSRGPPDQRAKAIEFLDNVLARDDRALLLPLLEHRGSGPLPRPPALGASAIGGPDEVLAWLAAGRDAWLRACAVAHLACSPPTSPNLVELACDDPDPVVREMAEAAVSRAKAGPK